MGRISIAQVWPSVITEENIGITCLSMYLDLCISNIIAIKNLYLLFPVKKIYKLHNILSVKYFRNIDIIILKNSI